MGKGEITPEPVRVPQTVPPASPLPGVVAPVMGLIGAWIAAGSVGLIGHPLRHALLWLAMAAVVVAAWPHGWRDWRRTTAWIIGIIIAVVMSISTLAPVNVIAFALLLAAVAIARPETERALRAAVAAVAVFGIYRVALTSIPTLWLAADRAGGAIGNAAGWITRESLNVGATFGGLDFLVVMAALYAIWLVEMPRPRRRYALWGAAGILLTQYAYLLILSEAPNLVSLFAGPSSVAGAASAPAENIAALNSQCGIQRWISELAPWKELLPWNLPVLAALFQGGVAAAMFSRLRIAGARSSPSDSRGLVRRNSWALMAATGVLAALLPIAVVLAPYHATLEGKKVVAFEKGLLNWEKPVHGQYGRLMVGMYGMFGPFVESLGGSFKRSADLSPADLKDADLLVLFYPTREMNDDQLRRAQDYVKRGGKLLLMCDHTGAEPHRDGEQFDLKESRFNELLEPMSIHVAFDAAEFAVGGWLESYEALAHPTTLGIPDGRNVLGVVIGASLEIALPAQPILIGRWGYSDMGDAGNWQSLLGNQRYDPGEKLGDLILAAEQPWGDGRVLVFGDTSTLTNGIVIGSHPFASRLLAYMAGDGESARTPLHETAGAILAAVLIALLCWRPIIWRVVAAAGALSISLTVCVAVTVAATELLPSGKPGAARNKSSTNNLAYIDFAHLGSFSEETTRPDGIFGFEYALMRDDYLVLSLYELTYERLSRAGLFATIGPQRPFTAAERQAIRRFIEEGGIFILMAGYERSAASRELLDDFGFTIGAIPPDLPKGTEPAPMGHFKAPYLNPGDYLAYVRFHAAWPIKCQDVDANYQPWSRDQGSGVVAKGFADRPFDPAAGGFRSEGKTELPVIIVRQIKKGKIVVIGDSEFALNKNLENEDGSPIEGLRENADFWRWFLADLRGLTPWIPPKPQPQVPPEPGAPPAAIPELPAALPAIPEANDKKSEDKKTEDKKTDDKDKKDASVEKPTSEKKP